MKITRVKVTRIRPVNGMVAFADIVLDEKLLLSSIALHEKRDGGYRLTYPSKLSGKFEFPIFHPVNRELGKRIEQAVTQKLKEVTDANVRYSSDNPEK